MFLVSSSLVAIVVGFVVEAVLTVLVWGIVGAVVGSAAGVVGAMAKRGPASGAPFPYRRALYIAGFLIITLTTGYSAWLTYHDVVWKFAAVMLMYYARVIGAVPGMTGGYSWVRRRLGR